MLRVRHRNCLESAGTRRVGVVVTEGAQAVRFSGQSVGPTGCVGSSSRSGWQVHSAWKFYHLKPAGRLKSQTTSRRWLLMSGRPALNCCWRLRGGRLLAKLSILVLAEPVCVHRGCAEDQVELAAVAMGGVAGVPENDRLLPSEVRWTGPSAEEMATALTQNCLRRLASRLSVKLPQLGSVTLFLLLCLRGGLSEIHGEQRRFAPAHAC